MNILDVWNSPKRMMLFRICVIFLLLTFVIGDSSASAANNREQDQNDLDAAFDALRKKDFEKTVSKATEIIDRFSDGKETDTSYRCTSGQSDTLETLIKAAALSLEAGDDGDQSTRKNKTVAVSKTICSAHFVRAFALIDLSRRDEALPGLEIAVEMDPDNQHYINELGEWYKAKRDWRKSLEIFTKASQTRDFSILSMKDKDTSAGIMNKRQCRSYRGIAFNHVEMGNWDEARSAVEKCLKLIPNEPKSQKELEYIDTQSAKE